MQKIRTLAPSIIHALQAIERGCRRIQQDHQFVLNVNCWLYINEKICYGCLATCASMQLSNTTSKDFIQNFSADKDGCIDITELQRMHAFGIEYESESAISEFSRFEMAIDSLRFKDLAPLLRFYKLENHENATLATKWLYQHQPLYLAFRETKKDLLLHANFLQYECIPKMEVWFASTE